jgi:hypothetical protein
MKELIVGVGVPRMRIMPADEAAGGNAEKH